MKKNYGKKNHHHHHHHHNGRLSHFTFSQDEVRCLAPPVPWQGVKLLLVAPLFLGSFHLLLPILLVLLQLKAGVETECGQL